MTPTTIYNNVCPLGPDGRLDVARLVPWGRGVEVLTRPMCGGCHDLIARLTLFDVPFRELCVDSVDGLAAWAFYGSPPVSPAVAINGELIDGGGDPERLFAAALDRFMRRALEMHTAATRGWAHQEGRHPHCPASPQ